MQTTVYFIRHAVAPYSQENYHGRSLSPEGCAAAEALVSIFESVPIDAFISSYSPRAVETIQPIATRKKLAIETHDSLQELLLRGPSTPLPNNDLDGEIHKVFEDGSYKLPGGESANEVLGRAAPTLTAVLEQYAGKTIILGTHGIIMTLLLRSFDVNIGFDFWKQTTKPDVYRVVFNGKEVKESRRILK